MTTPSDDFLAAAFRRSPNPMLGVDPTGLVRYANPAAHDLLGAPSGTLIGQPISNLLASGRQPFALIPGSPGEELRDEWQLRRRGGGTVRVEATVSYDAASGYHLVCLRDLDAADRRERSLRESEELFARSFLGAPLALSVSNAQSGSFLLVNDEFLALTGYWRSDVIGNSAEGMGLWDDPSERSALGDRLAAGERTPGFQAMFRRKDGTKAAAAGRVRTVEIGGQLCVITAALPLA